MKTKALHKAEKQTVARFARREAQKTINGATFVAHVEGRTFCEALLPDLAEFMLSREAPSPPKGLDRPIRQLAPEELAFVALSPLIHQIAVGWKKGDESAVMKLKLAMGRALHAKLWMKRLLAKDRGAYERIMKSKNRNREAWKYRESLWPNTYCVRAGNWLLDCVLQRLAGIFILDKDGFPCVTKEGEEFALRLCDERVYRDPVFVPTISPPANWTNWRSGGYWDDGSRISATFIRSSHQATERAARRAFCNGHMKQHVDGVNTLQRVGLMINAAMIPVVEKFAGKIGKKVHKYVITQDVSTANALAGKTFFVPMNCDFRGRVYGVSHFNFQREDHVRSLFKFAQGMPIGDDGLRWLMIHVANCGDFDKISKRPWHERIAWVEGNRDKIICTAQNPEATLDWWRQADAPFSFVAGCIELAAAWEIGPGFVTHLPVCFDGSCNGVQHSALIMLDEEAGKLVNLVAAADEPQDIYQLITDTVFERLRADINNKYAKWWLDGRISRKLIKRPAMTFAYSVTLCGMRNQLVETYSELHELAEPTDAAAQYLAQHIMAAAKEILRRPAAFMDFIRELAKERAAKGEHLEWVSPTGFPWANRYYNKSTAKMLHLELRGECVRHKVADGFDDSINKQKAMNGAAPNFVHALDASHLIRVVNAAAIDGITSLATIHDSFGCLAPQATELHRIIRSELAELHGQDVLADLRDAAGSSLPLPPKGKLDPRSVLRAEYAFA
jgi:DNA-directed RNA polymerase